MQIDLFLLLSKNSTKIQNDAKMVDAQRNVFEQIDEFVNNNNIKKENVDIYFQYVQKESIKITVENFRDIKLLSDFLQDQNLSQKLCQFIDEHKDDINWLIQQILDDIEDHAKDENYQYKIQIEMINKLCSKINECFNNDKFRQLKPYLTHEIIAACDHTKINNDLLCDLILSSIEKNRTLLTFLDISKLTDIKFIELKNFYDKSDDLTKYFFQYLPYNLNFIIQLKEIINKTKIYNDHNKKINCNLKKQVDNLKKKIEEVEKQNDQYKKKTEEIEELKTDYKKRTEEVEKQVDNLKKRTEELEKQVDNLKKRTEEVEKQNDQYIKKIKEIEELNTNNKEEINNLNKKCTLMKNKIQSKHNKIIRLKKTINENEDELRYYSNMEKEKNDLQEELYYLKSKYRKIKTINLGLDTEIEYLNKKSERLESLCEDFSISLNSFCIKPSLGRDQKTDVVNFLKNSSQNGNCYSSYLLGILYREGNGVEKSFDDSKFYFELSANQGNCHGLNSIGYLYKDKGDNKNAIYYFEKAKQKGNSTAIYNLAEIYEVGSEKNIDKALKLYEKAAIHNSILSLKKLGSFYMNGTYVDKSFYMAEYYYNKAGSLGNSFSYFLLGEKFENDSIHKNPLMAKEYYQKAANLGNWQAVQKLKQINQENSVNKPQIHQIFHTKMSCSAKK